jgi:hypothetical protein
VPTDEAVMTFQIPCASPVPPRVPDCAELAAPDVIFDAPLVSREV